jgi:hypothetical protein
MEKLDGHIVLFIYVSLLSFYKSRTCIFSGSLRLPVILLKDLLVSVRKLHLIRILHHFNAINRQLSIVDGLDQCF